MAYALNYPFHRLSDEVLPALHSHIKDTVHSFSSGQDIWLFWLNKHKEMDLSCTSPSVIQETSLIKRRSKRDSVLLETHLATSFLTGGVRTESNRCHTNHREPRETVLNCCNEMETAGKKLPDGVFSAKPSCWQSLLLNTICGAACPEACFHTAGYKQWDMARVRVWKSRA